MVLGAVVGVLVGQATGDIAIWVPVAIGVGAILGLLAARLGP